jgi:hypothetical protein
MNEQTMLQFGTGITTRGRHSQKVTCWQMLYDFSWNRSIAYNWGSRGRVRESLLQLEMENAGIAYQILP